MGRQFSATNRALALRELVAQRFVPARELARAERDLYFDEDEQIWRLGRPGHTGALARLLSDARDVRVRFPRGNNAPEVVDGSSGEFLRRKNEHVMERPE